MAATGSASRLPLVAKWHSCSTTVSCCDSYGPIPFQPDLPSSGRLALLLRQTGRRLKILPWLMPRLQMPVHFLEVGILDLECILAKSLGAVLAGWSWYVDRQWYWIWLLGREPLHRLQWFPSLTCPRIRYDLGRQSPGSEDNSMHPCDPRVAWRDQSHCGGCRHFAQRIDYHKWEMWFLHAESLQLDQEGATPLDSLTRLG